MLRRHSAVRARTLRRVIGAVFVAALAVALAWIGWYAWSLRSASSSMQAPMRADRAAIARLASDDTDLTLLVVRRGGDTSQAAVAVLRQPVDSPGSWLLVLPASPLPAANAAGETPGVLLSRGRASLLSALESLMESRFRHYLEVDGAELSSAVRSLSLRDSTEATGTRAVTTSATTSSTVTSVADSAALYESIRAQPGLRGMVRMPRLASRLTGLAISDLSASEADAVLRRLGRDAAADRVHLAVAPVETANRSTVIAAGAVGVLRSRMLAGQQFGTLPAPTRRVKPGSVTVTVLNGAGREGVAGQAARVLKRGGYRVTTVGNANQFVYDATLVVYDDERPSAESVAKALRRGRVVASRGMYTFDSDVLVIVGGDWPQAP